LWKEAIFKNILKKKQIDKHEKFEINISIKSNEYDGRIRRKNKKNILKREVIVDVHYL
jgi:hypothetical protein